MRSIFFLLFLLLLFTSSFGQKNEVSLNLNSGLFSFSGQSTASSSFINYNTQTNSGYTNNPYGSKNGLCYGISGNLKRVFKKNFFIGIELGFEDLRSKVLINSVYTDTFAYSANGKTFLNNNFIDLSPYIGQRFKLKIICFDITGGLEFAHCLSENENGSAVAINNIKYTISSNNKTITTDIRPRIQVSANYHKSSIYIGYSYGVIDYLSDYRGTINDCSSRLIRFGIAYQIN